MVTNTCKWYKTYSNYSCLNSQVFAYYYYFSLIFDTIYLIFSSKTRHALCVPVCVCVCVCNVFYRGAWWAIVLGVANDLYLYF